MSVRSEATDKIIEWIDSVRTSARLNCPNFCKIITLDKAGEWKLTVALVAQRLSSISAQAKFFLPPGRTTCAYGPIQYMYYAYSCTRERSCAYA